MMDAVVRERRARRQAVVVIVALHLLVGAAVIAAVPLVLRPALRTLARAVAAPFSVMGTEQR